MGASVWPLLDCHLAHDAACMVLDGISQAALGCAWRVHCGRLPVFGHHGIATLLMMLPAWYETVQDSHPQAALKSAW
eukprot:scaffold131326_cov19-Tisochrysis_lutea.AAC.2